MKLHLLYITVFCAFLFSCDKKKGDSNTITTPWGEQLVIGDSGVVARDTSKVLTLDEIVESGELIVFIENGPSTYYEYRGSRLGTQYLITEEIAKKLGVKVRVEVCKDSLEMMKRLNSHEGDLVAFSTPGSFKSASPTLENYVKEICNPAVINNAVNQEKTILADGGVKRKVYSPYRDPGGGIISDYDKWFKQYGQSTGWDWRLIAAQCYQESTFDPAAVSFAGAKGLMQIMPGTATHLGMAPEDVYDPEKSIAAACKYINELSSLFSDVYDAYERQNFVLASYNGGAMHIRDAMALAAADGKNKYVWEEVKPYILMLATPQGYRNPVVKYGYMRGTETAGYVDNIRKRFESYGGQNNHNGRSYTQPSREYNNIKEFAPTATPQRATK